MHRVIRDHLEDLLKAEEELAGSGPGDPIQAHLRECEECSGQITAMREHARKLRELRAEVEPRPGFYARVRERIETQGAVSIWNVFSESPFGRRIALASMTLALALGVYLVTSEQMAEQSSVTNPTVQFVGGEDQPGSFLTQPGMMQPGMTQPGMMQPGMTQPGMRQSGLSGIPDRDSVLVNLVTYREQ